MVRDIDLRVVLLQDTAHPKRHNHKRVQAHSKALRFEFGVQQTLGNVYQSI